MRKYLLLVVAVFAFAVAALATRATGSYPAGNNAERCYRDAESIVNFYEANIANTPNPQLTFETGIYTSRTTGKEETYRVLLGRIAYYATLNC